MSVTKTSEIGCAMTQTQQSPHTQDFFAVALATLSAGGEYWVVDGAHWLVVTRGARGVCNCSNDTSAGVSSLGKIRIFFYKFNDEKKRTSEKCSLPSEHLAACLVNTSHTSNKIQYRRTMSWCRPRVSCTWLQDVPVQ